MPIVHMHLEDADRLVNEYNNTANNVRDTLASVSPFLTDAYALLDIPGDHTVTGPRPALNTLANDLVVERDDVSWRVDFIRTFDAQPIGLDGRVSATVPRNIEAAFRQAGLTDQQAAIAQDLIDNGASFAEAVAAAQTDNPQSTLDAIKLAQLNEQIDNWDDNDNWAGLDELLTQQRALINKLTNGAEPGDVDQDLVVLAAFNGISYDEAEFWVTAASIDELNADIQNWTGHPGDPNFNNMLDELNDQIDQLAGGDAELARQVRVHLNQGLPANEALFEGALAAFADTPLTELMTQLDARGSDPEDFDPIAMAMQASLLANLEQFTGADASDVNLGVAAMAQDNGFTYNATVAMLNMSGELGTFEFLDGPISSSEEAAFRILGDREAFDEIEHANGGWFGPDSKLTIDDFETVLANPEGFSAEAVALATFFSENPDEWAKLDTARDGIALSGLADGQYVAGDGDGTTSFADIEQYVTNLSLFNTLNAEMDRNGDFLQDLNGDGHLGQAEFEVALNDLATEKENFQDLQIALQVALDSGLMDQPDDRSMFAQIGDSLYTISSLTPLSPTNIYRTLTEPGELANDYLSFAQGAGNTVVAFGQMAYDVSVMSPLAPGFYFEAWRVDGDMEQHRGVQMARTLPVIAETAATLLPVTPHFWNELDEVRQTGTWDNHDGVNLVGAAIDFETFLENPAEWAGQFAPEVLISIATGGGGAITRVASTATRATSAARRIAATARRFRLPDGPNPADLRRLGNQKLDEIALTLFPQPGLRPAWADNVHMATNNPGSGVPSGAGRPTGRGAGPTNATPQTRISGNTPGNVPGVQRVEPIRAPDPNARPTGTPSSLHPNDLRPENIVSIAAENTAANWLARLGFDVHQQPTVGKRLLQGSDLQARGLSELANPDLLINGRVFDVYSPTNPSARNIWKNILKDKLMEGQTRRIVVNISGSKVDVKDLRRQFDDWPMQGEFNGNPVALEEAIFMSNGRIVGGWTRP